MEEVNVCWENVVTLEVISHAEPLPPLETHNPVKSSDASSHGFRTFWEDFCTSLLHHLLLVFTPLVQNKLLTCLLMFSVINMLPRMGGQGGQEREAPCCALGPELGDICG